ncbi:PEP-CTERM sorting domain-containing protein [Nostoc sp. FACHB-892]|uniref:PEP-CTERM sorting domain-containing protein n=1 Tax=Nostoc sp. FACHB-892 TaxID=2692843 RepID=UPI001682C5A2|nr:PEP-CTERM sorting domain-containing protein [Nostoc sp. FACHB-892]MBD2725061.1 PEP-CTERM sorting domain-containing protein [Nostoc sp. FACHB-892]
MKHLFSTLRVPSFLAATVVVISSSAFAPANAASMSFTINDFTGADTRVKFTLDDAIAGSGKVQFKVDYLSTGSNTIADIRGIFFNILDDSLLSGLKVVGTDVTASKFGPAGTVDSVGSSNNNLNGNGKQINFFDAGVEIGQEGIGGGKGDIQSTIFTLFHTDSSKALTLAQFSQQNFGVRLMSVGSGTKREESSKLKGQAPYYTPPKPPTQKVPEPTTLAALGLFALGALKVAKKRL